MEQGNPQEKCEEILGRQLLARFFFDFWRAFHTVVASTIRRRPAVIHHCFGFSSSLLASHHVGQGLIDGGSQKSRRRAPPVPWLGGHDDEP